MPEVHPASAATASMVPDPDALYLVTLPEGAAGYVQLEIAEWETTQAFYTEAAIDYTITTEGNYQFPGPRELVTACPDAGITGQAVTFPEWTPATIEFGATGPREIPFMIIRE